MCGRPSTTIGFERLYNPLLHLERRPFVSTLTNSVPPRPLNMSAIEATNRGLADMPQAMLRSTSVVAEIDVEGLERRSQDAVVLDVREPEEYAQGHVPGAINLLQAELASRLEELPHDRTLLTMCRSGSRSLRAARFLKQAGFDRVASVKGGTEAWRAVGKRLAFGEAGGVEEPRIKESAWAHAGVVS